MVEFLEKIGREDEDSYGRSIVVNPLIQRVGTDSFNCGVENFMCKTTRVNTGTTDLVVQKNFVAKFLSLVKFRGYVFFLSGKKNQHFI